MSNVYFSGSIRGGRDDANLYNKIIKMISKTDLVLTEHIGDLKYNVKKKNNDQIYNTDIDLIKKCDFIIAECSTPSLGVGYEIAYAEKLNKPIYVFYRNGVLLSAMLLGNKNCICKEYSDEEELLYSIKSILEQYNSKNEKKKEIILCTQNEAKVKATMEILGNYFDNYNLTPVKTNSYVSETPTSDSEGIMGCKNRINDAIARDFKGDIYISMEGILKKAEGKHYLGGWTCIYDRDKNDSDYFIGSSRFIKVPEDALKGFNHQARLSKLIGDYYGKTDEEVSKIGTNGIITNGAYTRVDEFKESLEAAMSTIYSKKMVYKPLNK